MRSAWRFSFAVFAGLILMQAAWIVTVPPFRGIDEFDHVFRAVGVADGQWRLSIDTREGRGLLVEVPSGVVQAASPQCAALGYTEPDNCFPVDERPNGRVTISTAAATYHPAYYFVIGTVGQFFEGAGVAYSMRAASALISSLGVACAAFCLVLAGGGGWARFGFLASLTPVLVYTTTLPAPNSMEIVAGLCLWTALVGVLRNRGDDRHWRLFLVVATTAACVLVTVRLLGPMWLGLIVLSVASWVGWTSVRSTLVRQWPRILAASGVVLIALVGAVWWSASVNQLSPSEDAAKAGELNTDLGKQPVAWVFQIIAAAPLRDDIAPSIVYAVYFLLVSALFIGGLLISRRRQRLVLLGVAVVILGLPIALTVATADAQGVIWQGRYGLPYVVGLTLLCGVALDDASFAPREGIRLRVLGCVLGAGAHAMGAAHVITVEHTRSVSVLDSAWLNPSPWVVVSLIVAGWLVWTKSVAGGDDPFRDRTESEGGGAFALAERKGGPGPAHYLEQRPHRNPL